MSGEPKTLTLAEFILRLGEDGAELSYQPDTPSAKRNPGYWIHGPEDATGPYATWEEAAEHTYGAVARDEVAELRAAAQEHLEALATWLKASGAEGNPIRHAAQVDFNASILALRAALAAHEGQP